MSRAANGLTESIRIRGARTHNLRNVDVDIPRDRFVVITGVSGSGKSSLAFDTLLAEGQRQYIESLSVYARQYFDQLERPDVDSIDGLQPAIAVDQHADGHNPRSTVGTVTEIFDYLRLLMARASEVFCHACGAAISQQSAGEIQEWLLALPEQTKVMILAPLVRGRRGQHKEVFATIRKAGLVRVRVDGATYPLEDVPDLTPQKRHDIEAVVDRIKIRDGIQRRLAESLRAALKYGDGVLSAVYQLPEHVTTDAGEAGPDGWIERVFNTRYACPDCHQALRELQPRTFSFNSPYGACPRCEGMGTVDNEDETETCPECEGSRLCPEARACKFGGKSIDEIHCMPIGNAREFFRSVALTEQQRAVAATILEEIQKRLTFLGKVGVDYLTLDRPTASLSGGELQRVRLATGIGSGLTGVLYVLDEPSIGLHPRDNERLIEALRNLQQQGNTVLVVEHDEAVMRACDHLIDMGPGAGHDGGRVVAEGSPDRFANEPSSLTGEYLAGRRAAVVPPSRRSWTKSNALRLRGATVNNLQDVDLDIPLGAFVCITGVSGSGKSSLAVETLSKELRRRLRGAKVVAGAHRSLRGSENLDRFVEVDQAGIGRTPRSNPATYLGMFDEIRTVFASTKTARRRGYRRGRFSFNTKGGRCEECQGQGTKKIEMNFLPDFHVSCPQCQGARFNRQTLQVHFRGRSIADVLEMDVDEALTFFENHEAIRRRLSSLSQVGLGYLRLGQPTSTLSGGEAQRIKLAAELGRPQTGRTLYILDEPTTGLHVDDIVRLLAVLGQLVEMGNSVLVIEHHLDVALAADWIIDLGPEGGREGGRVVVAGTPEQVAECGESHTGRYLANEVARRAGKSGN